MRYLFLTATLIVGSTSANAAIYRYEYQAPGSFLTSAPGTYCGGDYGCRDFALGQAAPYGGPWNLSFTIDEANLSSALIGGSLEVNIYGSDTPSGGDIESDIPYNFGAGVVGADGDPLRHISGSIFFDTELSFGMALQFGDTGLPVFWSIYGNGDPFSASSSDKGTTYYTPWNADFEGSAGTWTRQEVLTPIPLPASSLMLLAGFAALRTLRKRKF